MLKTLYTKTNCKLLLIFTKRTVKSEVFNEVMDENVELALKAKKKKRSS